MSTFGNACLLIALLTVEACASAPADASRTNLQGPANCGAAAVAVLAELLGHDVGYDEVMREAAELRDRESVSVRELVDLGERIGIELQPLQGEVGELVGLAGPAIIHLAGGPGHYVVLEYLTAAGGVIVETGDPSPRVGVVALPDLASRYSGVVLMPVEHRDPAAPVIGFPTLPVITGVTPGMPALVTMDLRNSGGAAFTYRVTGVNCKCLVPTPITASVTPDASVPITLEVAASGLRSDPTSLVVTCTSDIPDRPIFHLGALAEADCFGEMRSGGALVVRAGTSARSAIRTWLNHLAEPLEASSDATWARAVLAMGQVAAESRTAGTVWVEVEPDAPLGEHHITVAAAFKSEYAPALTTEFVVVVYPPVTASPSVLAVDPGVTRESVLRWNPEEVVSDLTLSTEGPDGCEVSYERTGEGEGRVRIVPPAEAPVEVITGWVRLTGTLASGLERVVGEVKVHLLPVDPFAPPVG